MNVKQKNPDTYKTRRSVQIFNRERDHPVQWNTAADHRSKNRTRLQGARGKTLCDAQRQTFFQRSYRLHNGEKAQTPESNGHGVLRWKCNRKNPHDLRDTNPERAEPESIRGQYGRILTTGVFENIVHASDSPESAESEIKLWFEPDEIIFDIYPSEEKIFKNYKKRVWKK